MRISGKYTLGQIAVVVAVAGFEVAPSPRDLAMMVAVLAPPPLPTKVFMLVAGAVGMPVSRFVGAVFAGRIIRFGLPWAKPPRQRPYRDTMRTLGIEQVKQASR